MLDEFYWSNNVSDEHTLFAALSTETTEKAEAVAGVHGAAERSMATDTAGAAGTGGATVCSCWRKC